MRSQPDKGREKTNDEKSKEKLEQGEKKTNDKSGRYAYQKLPDRMLVIVQKQNLKYSVEEEDWAKGGGGGKKRNEKTVGRERRMIPQGNCPYHKRILYLNERRAKTKRVRRKGERAWLRTPL